MAHSSCVRLRAPPAVMPQLRYQHPEATHVLHLPEGTGVAYRLVRSARRSIGLEVSAAGLTVRAPQHASQRQIDTVLNDKARWLLDKLHSQRTRQGQAPRIHWAHGASLPYLGGQLCLHLHPAALRGGELLPVADGRWVLHLPLPPHAAPTQVRASVVTWWLRQARALFMARLDHWAPVLGVRWRTLRLSAARTRWGSARSDGGIMLNWRLLHFRLPVLDYVVIHELAHLHEMNHSPRFWTLVAQACPDYLLLRMELQSQVVPQWGGSEPDGM